MSSSTRSSKKSSSSSSKVSRKASPEQQPLVNGNGNASAKSSSNGTAATAASTAVAEEENIFVFYPNIIGYVRIVLAIASLYYMPLHPRTCSLLYSVSCLLDALDGYAARIFDQSTRFGAVLDMVTDRCTTSCLLMFLACAFPRWTIVFQLLITLDFASHYMHMYASLTMGGAGTSHKNVDKERNWMLNLYYTNKTVLFVFCALNELFFIALYLLSFSSPLLSPSLLKSVGETGAAQIQAGAQVNTSLLSAIFTNPYSAAALELARANKMDSFWPWVLTGVSFPVMAAKQFINVVQLVNASKWLAEGDLQVRREQGLPKKKKTA
ncbi:CDP-diacylglycerol-inositol 3-phosphatidyltransferase [Verticillium nonalfalfae]|uniref:CDP-diacylglycerol-inositol 3-phosphatidyltransferase n=1 Tax=Verticillium nonalfalfae TaxID=1051616 RepID=A0A3M9YEM1_9PEZI|nr:CDP-diacylglycerol-inositol 3-phosphatidyltransferase [Verticillium nonalfalfae]RNJ57550.1 CDP-diacylglycerol-inositol 3-phosphatidyltransferase [Verticillium nonalfalfae]